MLVERHVARAHSNFAVHYRGQPRTDPECVANRPLGSEAKGQVMAIAKNTICVWYDKEAEAAARFYAETFPNSSMSAVHRAPTTHSAKWATC
jgi:hypothetical protein